jgi:hypothetical protein
LPEWYHLGLGEVNCGEYGFERRGHPPEIVGTKTDQQVNKSREFK